MRGHRGDSPAAVYACPVHGTRGSSGTVAPPPRAAGAVPTNEKLQRVEDGTASVEELDAWSTDPSDFVRGAVASAPHTSADTLHAMAIAQDRSTGVLARVAANPTARPDTLDVLARHPDPDVGSAAAGNPSTHADTLEVLLERNERSVTAGLLARNDSPIGDDMVQRIFAARDEYLANLAGMVLRARMAGRPGVSAGSISDEAMEIMAMSRWREVGREDPVVQLALLMCPGATDA